LDARTIGFACLLLSPALARAADPVASIDFSGGEQGRILVQAKVNDQGPFPFIFDTGSVNILSLDLAKRLGITVSGKHTMGAFGGPVVGGSAVVDSIQLGGVTMGRTELFVLGGGPFQKGGPVGFVGWEFLAKLVVEIDYEHGKLNFYAPETFAYTGHGVRVPLAVHAHNLLVIPGEVFGSKAEIQLDSGSESALVLFPNFVHKHRLHSDLVAITGYGFGGVTRAMVTRAPNLGIAGLEIKSPIVHLSLDAGDIAPGASDGNMGGPLLREFTCVYDVPHQAFYLEPNAWFGKPELTDRSGLVADTRGGPAKVLYVYPGSAAANAGISAGDELSDAAGQPLTNEQWHDLFDAAAGTTVRVTVKHAGRPRGVELTLGNYL
jgi:Aspartyl protease